MTRLPIESRFLNEPRLRAMMERRGIDALILRGAVNTKYISGFFHNSASHDGAVNDRPLVVFYFLDPARKPALLVPSVDLHLAMVSTWIEDVRGFVAAERSVDVEAPLYADFIEGARAILADRRVRGMTVGTEGDQLSIGFTNTLAGLLEGNRMVDVARDMGLVRMVKTPEEIRRLRRAAEITTRAHESFRAAARAGVTDHELYRAAAGRMIAEGAEMPRFVFVGAGPTRFAANPHFPTGYALKKGDFFRVDMGASFLGYAADFVRCYFLGQASGREKDVWRWLNEAQIETALAIRPGQTGGEIYQRGIEAIGRHLNDFPREFIGHGIGQNLNEEPRMAAGNRVAVEPGTVCCVEFSYYLDGGVRLHTEDTYLITDTGVEMLTKDCPRELVIPA